MATSGVSVFLVGWRNRRGQFAKLDDVARDAQRKSLQSVFRRAVKIAKEESPVGKGKHPGPRFRDAWRFTTENTHDGAEGELTNVAAHAGFVIFPTRRHPIPKVPKPPGRAIRFIGSGGKPVFRRQVMHPGTRGNDVPGRTLRRLGPEIDDSLRRTSREVQTAIVDIFSRA